MEVKFLLLFVAILLSACTTSARPRIVRRGPCSCPNPCLSKSLCFSNLATPFPCIEAVDYAPNAFKSCCCNDQLILPPLTADLPYGLGYFPSALPLVVKSFAPGIDCLTTGAYIPVSSPCDCLTLAAPVCPEYAPMVKPIIL